MQDAELFAKRPSDNEQRFDQRRQVGNILDKLLDPVVAERLGKVVVPIASMLRPAALRDYPEAH